MDDSTKKYTICLCTITQEYCLRLLSSRYRPYLGQVDEPADKLVVNAVMHIDPLDRAAALPAVEERPICAESTGTRDQICLGKKTITTPKSGPAGTCAASFDSRFFPI
jgi:hypothetical protein